MLIQDAALWIYWLVLFILLMVIELATMGLTTIWFAAGSLVALVLSLFDVPLAIQIIVFLTVAVILLIWTRPIAMRYFNRNRTRTNVESVIGKKALVIKTIDNIHSEGKVNLNGMEWSARASRDADLYQKDEIVQITGVQGVKLIVEKPQNKADSKEESPETKIKGSKENQK